MTIDNDDIKLADLSIFRISLKRAIAQRPSIEYDLKLETGLAS